MKIRPFVTTLVVCGTVASLPVWAGPEAGHPNIVAAREDAQRAIEKMHAAQVANEYDMGGHAAKAEKLLAQAEREMRLAAEAANARPKK